MEVCPKRTSQYRKQESNMVLNHSVSSKDFSSLSSKVFHLIVDLEINQSYLNVNHLSTIVLHHLILVLFFLRVVFLISLLFDAIRIHHPMKLMKKLHCLQ